MYRLELVEKEVIFYNKNIPLQDNEIISSPLGKELTQASYTKIQHMIKDFEKELKSGKYYIKLAYYEIEKEK